MIKRVSIPRLILAGLVIILFVHYFLNNNKSPINVDKISQTVLDKSAKNMIFRVKDLGLIDIKNLAEDLSNTRIIVVGESHDDAEHHRAQLLIIRALHEAGIKVAVGFEMFPTDVQTSLDKWVSGELSLDDFVEVYSANWDPNWWSLYRPIFFYAKGEKIPMVGLNISRSIVSKVAREGFDILSQKQKEELGVITCNVSQEYKNLLAIAMGNKKTGDIAMDRFCQAQVVWDTAMAQNALSYLAGNQDKILVVLAGSFHAWKHGIAEQVRRQSDIPVRVILPSSDKSFLNYNVMIEDADYVWWQE